MPIPMATRSACTSSAISPTIPMRGSDRCSSTPVDQASVERSSPSRPSSSTARTSSTASTSSAGIPAGTGESEPAIDCIDNYDEYYAANRHHPRRRRRAPADHRRRRILRRAMRRTQRGLHRVRRHQQLRTRHGHDPPRPRRGRDQLLRVQLRIGARWHVGDPVPRDRAGRCPRRRRAIPTPTKWTGRCSRRLVSRRR